MATGRIPGFAGHIPQYTDRIGTSFGKVEAGVPDAERAVVPASMGRVPGFSGFVPGSVRSIGNTFGHTTRVLGKCHDAKLQRPSSPAHATHVAQELEQQGEDAALESEREGDLGRWKKIAAPDRTEVPGYSGFVRDEHRWPSQVSMTAPTKMPAGEAKLNKGKLAGFSGFVPGFWCDPDNIGERWQVATTRVEAAQLAVRKSTPRQPMGGRVKGAAGGVAPGVLPPAPLESVSCEDYPPENSGRGQPIRQESEQRRRYAMDVTEVQQNIGRLNDMRFIPGYSGYTRGCRESYGVNSGRKARGDVEARELLEHPLVVPRLRSNSQAALAADAGVQETGAGGDPGSVPGYTGYVPRSRERFGDTFGNTLWAGR